MSETHSYLRHVKTDGGEIEFRLMSRSDEAAVLAFAQKQGASQVLIDRLLISLDRKYDVRRSQP